MAEVAVDTVEVEDQEDHHTDQEETITMEVTIRMRKLSLHHTMQEKRKVQLMTPLRSKQCMKLGESINVETT